MKSLFANRERLLIAAGAVLLLGLVVYTIVHFLSSDKPTRKQAVQEVFLLKPPPPPPPPPPQPKPPEPKVQEEVPPPEPEPETKQNDDTPEGKDLGVDADGTGGADGFGLVGRKGGRDLLSGRLNYAFYTSKVQQLLRDEVERDGTLRGSSFQVVVKLWFDGNGRIQRYELVGSSGNANVDKSLKAMLASLPGLQDGPPADMPQPVKLRIASRHS